MKKITLNSITISLFKASDRGYLYDIYLNNEPEDIDYDTESDDGGQCTSNNTETAIKMATDHAIRLLQDIKNGAI